MKVAVTGATGLIGRQLCSRLVASNHKVVPVVRDVERARASMAGADVYAWRAELGPPAVKAVDGCDAVVNLAGESIAAGRWTERKKRAIRDSRVSGTRNLVEALKQCGKKPRVLVNASAIGYYGDRGAEILAEDSPAGSGFLAATCIEWEREAAKARDLGIRVVFLRTGIVLWPEGGALKPMMLPFKLFVGGPVGSGQQYMSWIHMDDEVDLIIYALENGAVSGPLNAAAPNPETNAEFSRKLAAVLHRPCLFKVPAFVLRTVLGEMSALLLDSQRVAPRKAQQTGYGFKFPELRRALENLLSVPRS